MTAPAAGSSRARRYTARAFCAVVLGTQLYFVLRAYHDPLKHFGFQPFSESTTWSAQIDAVGADGTRHDMVEGFAGYRWDDLVRDRVNAPSRRRHASSGIGATLYFLQHALDYVADRTPGDTTTRYLEARVRFRKNRGPEEQVTLRSHARQSP